MSSAVVDATKDTFDELVRSGVVLIDVWAQSCRPCVALAPHMASIAATNPDLTVVKLDAGKARRLCMSLQVRGLPTILLFHDGKEVARISDPSLTADQVDAWLVTALAQLPTATQLPTEEA
ncbi:MAG TPA: thioredoxin family protein [Pseudonocardiaceae bacterium]|jgi:thioredoxin-like negative regulator of GroEL|nr:thioredoxin family protein [Pseudonocardiaceae bacterium]